MAKQLHSKSGIKAPVVLEAVDDQAFAFDIKARCREVLVKYMVPDLVVPLTKLPLALSSGKADLKHLKRYSQTCLCQI